jgi:hypothetical protein
LRSLAGPTSIQESTMKKKQEPQHESLVVTLSGKRGIHDVARDLKASGFKVDQIMDAIGVVTGSAPSTHVDKLRKVSGVQDVSAEHAPFNIGPPGSIS